VYSLVASRSVFVGELIVKARHMQGTRLLPCCLISATSQARLLLSYFCVDHTQQPTTAHTLRHRPKPTINDLHPLKGRWKHPSRNPTVRASNGRIAATMADHGVTSEIKADPADTKKSLAEIDEFEEDHDLQIPADPPQGWLARVPPELWQAWSEMYSNAPSEQRLNIGTMRVFTEHPGQPKIELYLDRNVPQTKEMPQTYQLKVHASQYNNSVVFSEKDLPGHKTQSFGRNRHNAGKSAGVNKYDRFNQQPVKRINGYSSVIPKETALAARIVNEANVIPVEDKDYYESLKRTLTQAMQPKVNTTIHSGLIKAPAPGQANETFSTFTSGTTAAKGKKKVVKDKNVRMEQTALYDAIHRCFSKYKYWSLKALRNELHQPEDYIRKTLESIGTLIRSGDFAMQYVLKPEYAASVHIKDEDVIADAAAVESGDSDSGGDGDDDMELEDVKMGE
jgi:transcription initiation factor TFIIF subunit beta